MTTPDPLAGQAAEIFLATLDPRGTVVHRNRSWIRLLGDGPEVWDRLDSQDVDAAARCVAEAGRGMMVSGQLFLVPSDGPPVPLLLHFLPVHDPAEPGSTVAVVVTGELLVQPESWTSAQTERHRMETLGRMTMGMAHDFNNLLSAILGHVELLRVAMDQHARASLQEHIGTIERAASDGAALIEKVQRYIRQEQQATYEPVELHTLIQDAISLTRPYWYNEPRRQGIEITMDARPHEVPPLLGSPAELRDVLVNLILNAVQAMPAGGTIRIETESDGHRTGFTVSDTGTGMSPAVVERIFEPMFTTKGERGNGMGLAVTYGIVQEHGGAIRVDSEPGVGSTFHVGFPTAPAGEPPDADAGTSGAGRSVRVLVVDDEAMVRSVLRRLLSLRGHEVVEAASGAEGLELLGHDAFDVVVTDQGMPGMSGREFARAARDRGIDVPIVLLTGDTHVGGADDLVSSVLAKPFRIEEVERTILRLA